MGGPGPNRVTSVTLQIDREADVGLLEMFDGVKHPDYERSGDEKSRQENENDSGQ